MKTKKITFKFALTKLIILLLVTFFAAHSFAIAKHLGENNSNDNPTIITTQKKPALVQNYPNPFKQKTTIAYNLSRENGSIIIFDLLGKSIATFQLDKMQGEVVLDETLEAGMYFYSLIENDEVIATKHMNVTY
ncbi:MAG: T9SS type A sorting domain-containing protein [Chitinophagales bacterium]